MSISKETREIGTRYSDEEEEENFFVDSDSCTPFELEQSFRQKYLIADESAVSLKEEYILSLCCDRSFTCIAAGFSNGTVHIFDISNQRGLLRTSSPEGIPPAFTSKKIPTNTCGVRFLDETANSLLIGNTNGVVCLYDLRTKNEQARFEETLDITRSFTAFDCNANGRVLCIGTDQAQNDVYLIFFDIRQRKQLGGYLESHEKDITAVRFHDANPDILCTGCVDGLINVFNIAETSEDDALQTTINTENSIEKLSWHKNVYGQDIISCITSTNDFKSYECQGDLIAHFERLNLTEAIRRKIPANCNLVGCHNMADGSMFLLAGTNFQKGKIMRSVLVQNKQLLPLANFEGNKQIIRESVFDAKSNTLVTGGESGIVTIWRPSKAEDIASAESDSRKLKIKTQLKSNKITPY